jgi:hypothetical protein
MKRSLSTIALLIAAALPAAPETRQERGKKVIDAALAALGGNNFLSMEDRIESGRVYSFYRERLSGLALAKIYTRYLSRPDRPPRDFFGMRERESFGKGGNDAVLFTDRTGYEITFRGARPLPDEQVTRYYDSALHNVFYILRMRLGEPGLTFDSRGSDIVDNQPVDIVDITDADNRTVTVNFNQMTHLPSRQLYYRRDPKSGERFEEVSLFSKYRDVGNGVMWPYAIERVRDGEKIFSIFSDSVEINRNLTDDLFTLPAKIKILKKEK